MASRRAAEGEANENQRKNRSKPRSPHARGWRHTRAQNTPLRPKRANEIAEAGQGNPDDLLSTPELASWFKMSKEWFELARMKGYGPHYIKVTPKRIRYRRDDVLAWLKSRTVATR